MKKFCITTFGCQMNAHDSEKIAGVLRAGGIEECPEREEADIIVFNTCSIRQKAEQKFRSELGRVKALKKMRPGLKVAVAGCIAKQCGQKLLKKSPHIDYVIGPGNIGALADLLKAGSGIAIDDNPHLAETELPAIRKDAGRAWVSIMYGCNNFCSYCIVPYTRGREVSRPAEGIIAEVRGLVSEGFSEVTLLGQNVNSYKSDMDFPMLLEGLDKTGIKRIRFVTSHPRDLSDRLIEAIAGLESVCEQIHLPLQSASSRMLSLMNRGYSFDDYRRSVDKLRDAVPDIALTTDIICGFPTEAEGDHKATVDALKDIGYDGIFAFMYSTRPGTRASLMEGQLPEAVKSRRLTEVLAVQDEITLSINKAYEGRAVEILVEGPSDTDKDRLTGRTRTNKIVNFPFKDGLIGKLATVKILRAGKHSLEGAL